MIKDCGRAETEKKEQGIKETRKREKTDEAR
jgi:hypothetical protein